jgi:quercetin 2,3-dioxygenase
MHWHEEIPIATVKDENGKTTTIKIVAGNFGGKTALPPAPGSWASNPDNEVAVWIIQMEAGAKWTIPAASETVSRSLFFFKGSSIEIENQEVFSNHSISLKGNATIEIRNGSETSRFLFLQGTPINEPVVQYGPFVMNSNAEIQQAMSDYRKTQFGGWPWPRYDMVHGPSAGRFAKYADGKMETPL